MSWGTAPEWGGSFFSQGTRQEQSRNKSPDPSPHSSQATVRDAPKQLVYPATLWCLAQTGTVGLGAGRSAFLAFSGGGLKSVWGLRDVEP